MTSIRHAKKYGLRDFAENADKKFKGNADVFLRSDLSDDDMHFLMETLGMWDNRLEMMKKHGGILTRPAHTDMSLGDVITGDFAVIYEINNKEVWRGRDETYTLPARYFTTEAPQPVAA